MLCTPIWSVGHLIGLIYEYAACSQPICHSCDPKLNTSRCRSQPHLSGVAIYHTRAQAGPWPSQPSAVALSRVPNQPFIHQCAAHQLSTAKSNSSDCRRVQVGADRASKTPYWGGCAMITRLGSCGWPAGVRDGRNLPSRPTCPSQNTRANLSVRCQTMLVGSLLYCIFKGYRTSDSAT